MIIRLLNNSGHKSFINMEKKLKDRVDDGFNYFNSGMLEDLRTDQRYYVKAFMDYIEHLEKKNKKNVEIIKKLKN